MNVAALILARAGSKGVKGKNTCPVGGRPCIEWTLDDALRARTVGVTAVSSDCPQALAIARARGAFAIDRPPELATDIATVEAAAVHALATLEDQLRATLDAVVILYANVPLRPPSLIDSAVALLTRTSADSVQSYSPVGKHHPLWTAVVGRDGVTRPWQGDVLNNGIHRRQDLPLAHIPDGGVLCVTRRALCREIAGVPEGPHAFLGSNRRGIVNPEGSVVDIDSEIDVIVADTLLRRRQLGVAA